MCPAGKMALHRRIIKSLLSDFECGIFLIPVRHNEPVCILSSEVNKYVKKGSILHKT